MIIKIKKQIILALIVSCVFFFQSCQTILTGLRTSQRIPVTSKPLGAKITVDGIEVGYAPLELKLDKRKSHTVRIERPGYNPLEIRIARKIPLLLSSVFLNWLSGGGVILLVPAFFITAAIFPNLSWSDGLWRTWIIAGSLGLLADFASGAIYTLSPHQLFVTLTKMEGKPQPNFILVDSEQFQNIKWIRIKCADSDAEEIVNLD